RAGHRLVAVSSPASTATTPSSCTALGDSLKISAARITEPTGCTVSNRDVSAAGRRGSETVISSQPSTCEVRARTISQPAPGQDGPGHQRHQDYLDVGQHGGQPGSDVADRVMPQEQIDGEEHAAGHGNPPLLPGPRSVAAILTPGDQAEHRERVGAAEDRGGG